MAQAAGLPYFPDTDKEDRKSIANDPEEAGLKGLPAATGNIHRLRTSGWPNSREAQNSSVDSFYEGLSSALKKCAPSFRNIVATTGSLGRRIKTMKEERPLRLLAILGGAAFTVGFAVRLWRSR